MNSDEQNMWRAVEIAGLGLGATAPNPLVGALLVAGGRIIGEGYHRRFGGPHAEPECIHSVSAADQPLIPHATLFVTLEPCAHFGKTPPCADLIIRHRIPRVVIGAADPFPQVDGKGIQKLRAAGVEVTTGALEAACQHLNRRFLTQVQQQRPYIILKWAESLDRKLSSNGNNRLLISNEVSNRLVHRWRAEEAAILVGTNTAMLDDPSLNTRLWPGKHPLRVVIDKHLRLPIRLKLFDQQHATIVFNYLKHESSPNLTYHQIDPQQPALPQVLSVLHGMHVQSILVEGGATLLQSFIDAGLWDEARIISSTTVTSGGGIAAPSITSTRHSSQEQIGTDIIRTYFHHD